MSNQKRAKCLFASILAAIVGIAIMLYDSDAIGTAIFTTIFAFVLLWCIYDLISHIIEGVAKGFRISPQEGHGRILLLLNLALGSLIAVCTNFVIGLLFSFTLCCIYWIIVAAAQLINKAINRKRTCQKGKAIL